MMGEKMIADIGTKALSAPRLEMLKDEMGMGKKKVVEKLKEEEEKREGRIDPERAKMAVQLIAIAASLTMAKAEEDEVEETKKSWRYTVAVTILVILVSTWVWRKIGVRSESQRDENTRRLPAANEEETSSEGSVVVVSEEEEEELGRRIEQALNDIAQEEKDWEETYQRREITQEEEEDAQSLRPAFQVFTTKFGKVYHKSRNCRVLQSPQTGASRESLWCTTCQKIAKESRGAPPPGIPVWVHGWGIEYHSNPRCPQKDRWRTERFLFCQICQEELEGRAV